MPQHYLELLLEVLLTSSPIKGDSMHLIYLYLALVNQLRAKVQLHCTGPWST
jgi:hypothetical protein